MTEFSIVFSDHALFQMKERKIEKQKVLDCLLRADKVVEESTGRYRAVKSFQKDGRTYLFVVAYDQQENQIEIVTAFITSKLRKYL